jgi:hypothetical protein
MGMARQGSTNRQTGNRWPSGGNPWNPCSRSFVGQLIPPILATLVRGLAGNPHEVFNRDALQPDALAFATKVAALQTAELDFTSPAGKRLQVRLDNVNRDRDDLTAALSLQMNGQAERPRSSAGLRLHGALWCVSRRRVQPLLWRSSSTRRLQR